MFNLKFHTLAKIYLYMTNIANFHTENLGLILIDITTISDYVIFNTDVASTKIVT